MKMPWFASFEYTTRAFLSALLDAVVPPHERAAHARLVSEQDLASLFDPRTLAHAPWIHALFPYRNTNIRTLVQAVKYNGERRLVERVAPFAADYLLELIAEQKQFHGWSSCFIAPIPASPARFRERGYAQAALYARTIARLIPEVRYDAALLTKENRPSQVSVLLPSERGKRKHVFSSERAQGERFAEACYRESLRTARSKNVSGAFSASPACRGHFIVLIDDVVESGATLTDARRALLKAGAHDVLGLAIAH